MPPHPDPSALLASILKVMTRHAETGCPKLAQLVARELQVLIQLSADDPLLGATARHLAQRWQLMGTTGASSGTSVH